MIDHRPPTADAHGTSGSNDRHKPAKAQITPLQATVELLKRGHRELLPRLRQLLRDEPEIWQYIGDLAHHSRRSWIELAGGEDELLKESAALYAEERVKEIAGDNPNPLELLLSERIVAHELRALYLEAADAQNIQVEGTPIAEFRLKKQEIADRQLARAVNLLAKVRGLLPRGGRVDLPASLAPDSVNAESDSDSAAETETAEQRSQALGVNRINGHVAAPFN